MSDLPIKAATPLNILIIGGSGFLSGTLARMAVAAQHRVWTVTRGQRSQAPGVTALVADRHNEAEFASVIAGANARWDLAVDCIAFGPDDIRQDVAVLSSRVRHLIFVSTDFVYDPARRRFPQAEESDFYLTDGYGGLKRQAEVALAAAETGDMAWTVLRPCHIYGPGSQLGCLPQHGRDPKLIERLRSGEPLRLVGGGYFLQQPVTANDLARVSLDIQGNASTFGQTFCVAGPDIVESQEYYRIIAEILGTELWIEEVPVDEFRNANPQAGSFLCHRFYDLRKLQAARITPPQTSLRQGLREHVASMI
jgi:nucleoside-diphosphate-sugar epimerase